MSFELPEALVLANQMNSELRNKTIQYFEITDYEKHQKDNWFNRDISYLENLINNTIISVESLNSIILINFKTEHVLLIGPEYGGEIRYIKDKESPIKKFHLKLIFSDKSNLFIRIKGFGYCILYHKKDISENYVYNRDLDKIKIINDQEFTLEKFEMELKAKNKSIKSLLVGKEAVVAGIANSLFHEIIYQAGIHPKEKSSNLSHKKINDLYNAIKTIISERINKKGKTSIIDLYGNQGSYKVIMDSSYYKKPCFTCKSLIEKVSVGGGVNYFCPNCQKLINS